MILRLIGLLLAVSVTFFGCKRDTSSPGDADAGSSGSSSDRPQVAFVTNGVATFWTIAKAGVVAGGREFDVETDVRMPADGTAVGQKRIVEDLLSRGVDGLAISPIDPDNQGEMLQAACRRTKVITHDSDAPGTDRICYIGTDNYRAGRMCGQLVKEAIPDGGSVIILIGRLEQDNARYRRQGTIDELLDRPEDPSRFDPPGKILAGAKYTIVDTRTDQFDRSRAKQNAEDAIARYPDLDCMVGLFEYNPPLILEAVRDAGKLGEIAIVAFDEAEVTLQGIKDGVIVGTVVQNPYEYGFQSVRVLSGLARGDQSVLPEGRFLDIPARHIRKDNVDAFWAELKANLKTGE